MKRSSGFFPSYPPSLPHSLFLPPGKWCSNLANLLHYLINNLMKLLKPPPARPAAAAAGCSGLGSAGPAAAGLSPETTTRLAAALFKLASRAQFSKDDYLSRVACKALAQLAYLIPHLVLPLVLSRFRAALDTSTATHQLAAAITALALCVRPWMLTGWEPTGGSEAGVGEAESSGQVLAEAMSALLPGIDANDEPKTNAVLLLYTLVLSSLHELGAGAAGEEAVAGGGGAPDGGGGGGRARVVLPLYLEEWGEELVGRMMTLIQNLDTGPGVRADQARGKEGAGTTFLMQARGWVGGWQGGDRHLLLPQAGTWVGVGGARRGQAPPPSSGRLVGGWVECKEGAGWV